MLTIGVDIDLTIVPSDVYWEAWLKRHFEQISEIPKENADYNLGKYFKESKNVYGSLVNAFLLGSLERGWS